MHDHLQPTTGRPHTVRTSKPLDTLQLPQTPIPQATNQAHSSLNFQEHHERQRAQQRDRTTEIDDRIQAAHIRRFAYPRSNYITPRPAANVYSHPKVRPMACSRQVRRALSMVQLHPRTQQRHTGPISESDFFTWEALICGPKETPFVSTHAHVPISFQPTHCLAPRKVASS